MSDIFSTGGTEASGPLTEEEFFTALRRVFEESPLPPLEQRLAGDPDPTLLADVLRTMNAMERQMGATCRPFNDLRPRLRAAIRRQS